MAIKPTYEELEQIVKICRQQNDNTLSEYG